MEGLTRTHHFMMILKESDKLGGDRRLYSANISL